MSLPKRPFLIAAIITAALAALRLTFIAFGHTDLSPDEAHYWEWSRHLDFSYYSKPPLTAWLIYLSTQIFGHTEFAVRLFAVIGQSALALLAFKIAEKASPQTSAKWLSFATFTTMPLLALGGLLITPDVPCTVLWLAALYTLQHIDFSSRAPQWNKFITLGIIVGLAGLAKYTAAAFYPLLGIFLLINSPYRHWFLRPQIYAAGVLSLLTLSPVWYWNATNDFITFRHVLGQAAGESRNPWFQTLGDFLASQLGILSPIIFLLILAYWLRAKEKRKDVFLVFSLIFFALFTFQSLSAKVQANWPVLATTTAALGMCIWAAQTKLRRRILIVGIAFAATLSTLGHDTNSLRAIGLNIKIKNDPLKPVIGWQPLAAEIDKIRLQPQLANLPILTTRYQTAGELAFYLGSSESARVGINLCADADGRSGMYKDIPEHRSNKEVQKVAQESCFRANPHVLYINPSYRRQNQYDLWPFPPAEELQTALYINEQPHLENVIKQAYESCEQIGNAQGIRPASQLFNVTSLTYKTATIYLCQGYRGITRLKPQNY